MSRMVTRSELRRALRELVKVMREDKAHRRMRHSIMRLVQRLYR